MTRFIPPWVPTAITLLLPIWGPFILVSLGEWPFHSLLRSDAYSVVIFVLPVVLGSFPIWRKEFLNVFEKVISLIAYLLVGAVVNGLSAWQSVMIYGHH